MNQNLEDIKISVVIPAYNVENYIQKSADSILNQTHKNVELIIVDDESTDGTPQVVDEIAKKDSRVVVIHKKNGGVSAARNDGMKVSTGEYLHFLDADDWIDLDCYETMLKMMVEADADAGYFGWSKDNKYGTAFVQSKNAYTGEGDQKDLMIKALSLVGVGGGYESYGNYIWNKMYKRSSICDEQGNFILFDENVRYAEDGLWLMEVGRYWKKGVFCAKPFHHYFQNPASVMNDKAKYNRSRLGSQESHLKMLEMVKEFCPEAYEIHKDVCNQFFWLHVKNPDGRDPEFIAQVLTNIATLNDGVIPTSVGESIAEMLRPVNPNEKYLKRKPVKMALKLTKKLDSMRGRK